MFLEELSHWRRPFNISRRLSSTNKCLSISNKCQQMEVIISNRILAVMPTDITDNRSKFSIWEMLKMRKREWTISSERWRSQWRFVFRHIAEHMDVPIDTSKMTDQELQFHYFKMHDADNNNKLDGCELIKSLIHWHGKLSTISFLSSAFPSRQPQIFTVAFICHNASFSL